VTWRSESGSVFGYDVQARIFSDGRIDYSYRSARSMRWGAPVVHAGLPNSNLRVTPILNQTDATSDAATPPNAALRSMLDLTNVEVARVNDSDMLRVQLTLAATIDVSKLAAGEFLRYLIIFGQTGSVFFDIRPDGTTQTAPIGSNFVDRDTSERTQATRSRFTSRRPRCRRRSATCRSRPSRGTARRAPSTATPLRW